MKKPITIKDLKPNYYNLIRDSVEIGLAFGWSRAHKYTNKPDVDFIKENMLREIMGALCDKFDFGE
jgi:hypothetical protein